MGVLKVSLDDLEVPTISRPTHDNDTDVNEERTAVRRDEPEAPVSSAAHANDTSGLATQFAVADRGQLEDHPRSSESAAQNSTAAEGEDRDDATAESGGTTLVYPPTINLTADNDDRGVEGEAVPTSLDISARGSADVGSGGTVKTDADPRVEAKEKQADEDNSPGSTAQEAHACDNYTPPGNTSANEAVRTDQEDWTPFFGAAEDSGAQTTGPVVQLPTITVTLYDAEGKVGTVAGRLAQAVESDAHDVRRAAPGGSERNIILGPIVKRLGDFQGGIETGQAIEKAEAVSFRRRVGRVLKAVVCCQICQ